MDKPEAVHTYDGVLFGLKGEGNSDTGYDNIMLKEISRIQGANTEMALL